MHRLLDRLERAIAQGRIPREVPFLRAERAVLLVRQGELDSARKELRALRALPDAQTNLALQAWLCLADGLADYFENVGPQSHEHVLRAYTLAVSAKAARIQALAAAWCAHMGFHRHDYAAAIGHVQTALRTAPAEHHSARSRAAVVVGNLYNFAGREDLAQPWYVRARTHAGMEGDGATLSSITYNLTALRVIHVRLADVFGEFDEQAARRAMIGTESSAFLDRSVQALALSSLSSMQRAQILAGNGRFAEALAMYDAELPQALAQGLTQAEGLYRADRAWCLLQLGRGDEALGAARHAATALEWASEVEERAVAHALLARVFGPLGLAEAADHHAGQGLAEWTRYQQRCDAILQMLGTTDLDTLAAPDRAAA